MSNPRIPITSEWAGYQCYICHEPFTDAYPTMINARHICSSCLARRKEDLIWLLVEEKEENERLMKQLKKEISKCQVLEHLSQTKSS